MSSPHCAVLIAACKSAPAGTPIVAAWVGLVSSVTKSTVARMNAVFNKKEPLKYLEIIFPHFGSRTISSKRDSRALRPHLTMGLPVSRLRFGDKRCRNLQGQGTHKLEFSLTWKSGSRLR